MIRRITIVAAMVAPVWAAPANAHLIVGPKCDSLQCRLTSQSENLAHAQYVCTFGGGHNKQWSCAAVRWLSKELGETKAALAPVVPSDLPAWTCIHGKEGSWDANTGNGYYGGLQMDYGFMQSYGATYLYRYGTKHPWTANNWSPAMQIEVARRARDSGRGYYPWPNTARKCGLI